MTSQPQASCPTIATIQSLLLFKKGKSKRLSISTVIASLTKAA
ncbi:hypothetical protein [Photobacterium aquimaris]|nr:hypothetical protein [Photobacterium aquimaris]